jgi:hypothetical protein
VKNTLKNYHNHIFKHFKDISKRRRQKRSQNQKTILLGCFFSFLITRVKRINKMSFLLQKCCSYISQKKPKKKVKVKHFFLLFHWSIYSKKKYISTIQDAILTSCSNTIKRNILRCIVHSTIKEANIWIKMFSLTCSHKHSTLTIVIKLLAIREK